MTQLEKKHVKIVTTILTKNISAMMEERWWRISLNCYGQQFQQNQQPPPNFSSLNLNKKTITYDFGNPCPGLGQAQICGRVNGTLPPLNKWISNGNANNKKKKCIDSHLFKNPIYYHKNKWQPKLYDIEIWLRSMFFRITTSGYIFHCSCLRWYK